MESIKESSHFGERPMTRDIEKKDQNEIIRHTAKNDVEILEPEKKAHPFISFRYSYKSISSKDGKTHIKSKEKSFENGKFQSEEFEGTLPGNVFINMAGDMQKHIWSKMTAFMKPFGLMGKDKNSK
jgi:hypothetical protein